MNEGQGLPLPPVTEQPSPVDLKVDNTAQYPAQAMDAVVLPTVEVSDSATPDQATPDQATPDQATPDQATPDQVTPDQVTPDVSAQPGSSQPQVEQSAPAAPEQPQVTPLQKLRELQKSGFIFPQDVLGELRMMEKYNVLKDGKRTAELAVMSVKDLRNQPEYVQMQVRNTADEKQRPGMMGAEFVIAMSKQVTDLKTSYGELSPQAAMDKFELDECQRIVAERLEKKRAEEAPDSQLLPPDSVAAITATITAEAAVEAQGRKEQFWAAAAMMMGDYVMSGLVVSDFGTFLDNFFSQAVSRGGSWSNHRKNFADQDKTGEMVVPAEVFTHFKSKRELVKSLIFFYDEEVSKNEQLRGTIDRPDALPRQTADYEELEEVDLQIIMRSIAELLQKDLDDDEPHAFQSLEAAILRSMNKDPLQTQLDSRVILNLIAIGHPDKSTAFKEFSGKFTDVSRP